MGHGEWVTKKSCKNGTQLAYQPLAMRSLITLAALGGFAYGCYDFYKFMKTKRIARSPEKELDAGEGEGDAVRVAKSKTAAQVRPQKRRTSSSPGVS